MTKYSNQNTYSGRLNEKKKKEPTICCLQKTHFRAKCTHRLKVRKWKKIHHTNGNNKKVVVATLISDKIDFKTKAIKKDKEGESNDKRINIRKGFYTHEYQFSSVAHSCLTLCNIMDTRHPCPLQTPGAWSNSVLSSQ